MLPILLFLTINIISRGPDLALYLTTPPTQWFTGQASMFDPWDINVYLTAVNQGRQGHLLLNNRYDAIDSTKVLLYPFYTLLGFITKPLPFNPPLIFHLAAVIVSWFLVTQIWELAKILLPKNNRVLSWILVLFGGGVGWATTTSADVSNANFTLHAALRTPHEGLSFLLFLIAIKSVFQKTKIPFILAVIGLCLIHPYLLLPLTIITGITNASFLIPTLSIGGMYYVILGRSLLANPSYDTLFHQTHIPHTITEIIFGFGMLTFFIASTIKHYAKNTQQKLLLSWFFTLLILVLLPTPINRLFVKSLWIPAVFLASTSLSRIQNKTLRYICVFVCCISTLFIFHRRLANLGRSPWVRLSQDEHTIIKRIPCTENTVVLAAHPIANLLPTTTLCRTYAGHQVQTPDFKSKFNQVATFFAGQYSQTEAENFLKTSHANLIVWGPEEQLLGNQSAFPYPSLVTPIITTPTTTLYQYE